MVNLSDKDLYQLLIAELRYAIKRDNHLAPGTCIQHIKTYLPQLAQEYKAVCARQLADEAIQARIQGGAKGPLAQDEEWEDLLVFLLEYLESMPVNAGIYMQYLYKKPLYSAEIDFWSPLLYKKFSENKEKA